jgi:hypothetical protein
MNLRDWAAIFFDQLGALTGRRFEYEPNSAGYFQAKTDRYGILIIGEAEDESLVWLLDAEGRTNGPSWIGAMTKPGALSATVATNRVIEAMPLDGFCFNAWPPGPRELVAEDAVNAAWMRVQNHINEVRLATTDETSVRGAIQDVEDFIDRELAKKDDTVSDFAAPFKHKAAELIRLKFNRAPS